MSSTLQGCDRPGILSCAILLCSFPSFSRSLSFVPTTPKSAAAPPTRGRGGQASLNSLSDHRLFSSPFPVTLRFDAVYIRPFLTPSEVPHFADIRSRWLPSPEVCQGLVLTFFLLPPLPSYHALSLKTFPSDRGVVATPFLLLSSTFSLHPINDISVFFVFFFLLGQPQSL